MSASTIQGRHYLSAELIDVHVEGGRVVRICAAGAAPPDLGGPDVWLAPALIDVQVNGFAGHNLNSDSTEAGTVDGVVRGLWAAGVGLFCPTITTGSHERMCRSLRAVADACDAGSPVRHAVATIHIEGPYISPEDGPRGAHQREFVRPPDWDEFCRLQDAARGRIGKVTLAPEIPGALAFVERLAREGGLVAIGHHGASPSQIADAVRAGARHCTHLGNGAHAQLPRHPNYIWEQLANDELTAGIIPDGHHLPPSVLKCFVRVKGLERTILVSDAIHLAGQPPGEHVYHDMRVELTPDRKVALVGTPYLAGSALELAEGVGNAARFAGLRLHEAIHLATRNPARLLGREGDWGHLGVGRGADLVLLRWEAEERRLSVAATVIQGEVVFRSSDFRAETGHKPPTTRPPADPTARRSQIRG